MIGGGSSTIIATNTNIVQSYNVFTNTWSAGVGMPTADGARGSTAGALASDGRIFVYGGFNTAATALTLNQALTTNGGPATLPGKPPFEATADATVDLGVTFSSTVIPIQGTSDSGSLSGSAASDTSVPLHTVDAVFATQSESLSVDLSDGLLTSAIA